MKNFVWILVLVLSVACLRAEADPLTEPSQCLKSPKQINIEDPDMRFRAIKILQGKKILLESRIPEENLEIDCERQVVPHNKKYAFVRQKRKPSSTASAVITIFTFGISELAETDESNLKITSNSEVPVHTTITVPSMNNEISVADAHSGKSFRIECLDAGGVRLYARDPKRKEVSLFVVKGGPKTKSTGSCSPTNYNLNLAQANIVPVVMAK